MKTEIVTITPAMAEKWLAGTTMRNRRINKDSVRMLADAMSCGRWHKNGESIIIDDNGNVLDGQHRLGAVIRSGTTQTFVVVRGVSPDAFKSIDSGRKRTFGDILTIAGIPNSKNVAAACSAIYTFERDGEFAASVSPTKTMYTNRNAEYDPVYEAHKRTPLIFKSVQVGHQWRKVVNARVASSLIAATHYILSCVNSEEADDFFDRTLHLQFWGSDDPRKRLFEVFNQRGRGDILSRDCNTAAALIFKAWNISRSQGSCKFLRFYDNEKFPEIDGYMRPQESAKSSEKTLPINPCNAR